MKTLIERWEDKATAKVGVEDEERYGVKFCLQELSDSCTPRPPKPEWFGTGPGQWDRWMIGRKRTRGRKSWVVWTCSTHTWMVGYWPSRSTVVVPVAREGFPAPVGWHVVEGGR